MREAENKGRIMSKTFEETVKGGKLTFQACGRQAHVVSGRVLEPYLEIPDEIHGLVVTGIEKKAMLGSRALREAALRESESRFLKSWMQGWKFFSTDRMRRDIPGRFSAGKRI